MNREAFARETSLERGFDLREDVAVAVPVGEPLFRAFFQGFARHVGHADPERDETIVFNSE